MPEGTVIEGIIISDYKSANMETAPQISSTEVDPSLNFRTAYIQSLDGQYGFRIVFNSVYDNLERAVKQETADEAYKKGVEMTMNQLVSIFASLGVEIFGNVGDEFDPNIHNAVMHTEEEGVAENTITQVFQKGFKLGEKIVRFAMVQVAN